MLMENAMTETTKRDERAAFEAWSNQFDHDSNEYLDKGADEFFIAGYRAALATAPEQAGETIAFGPATPQRWTPEQEKALDAALDRTFSDVPPVFYNGETKRDPALHEAANKITPIPGSPAYALRGLYKPAMEYFLDGKPCTPDEYIAWQAGIIEAVTKAKLPDPKYYGGSAEEGDQHEVKCAYVDGWNDCRASILTAPPPTSTKRLTDDQIRRIWLIETGTTEQDSPLAILDFARAIIAATEGK